MWQLHPTTFYSLLLSLSTFPAGRNCSHQGLASPAAAAVTAQREVCSISIWGSQYADVGGSPASSPPQLDHRNSSHTFTRKSTQCLLIRERKHGVMKYISAAQQVNFLFLNGEAGRCSYPSSNFIYRQHTNAQTPS